MGESHQPNDLPTGEEARGHEILPIRKYMNSECFPRALNPTSLKVQEGKKICITFDPMT
jgi:uncharacterized protein YlaI